jgi:hypothetical protein
MDEAKEQQRKKTDSDPNKDNVTCYVTKHKFTKNLTNKKQSITFVLKL